MERQLGRRELLLGSAGMALVGGLPAGTEQEGAAMQEGQPGLRVGIVGCSEGTHGKVWGEMLATPEGRRFGMRPARVWDADPAAAAALARATGATAVREPTDVGVGVDGVLITELLPAHYLALARPFLERGVRVFFNRPFAGSVTDAREILRLAAAHGARVYSASALYHTAAADEARTKLAALGPIRLFNMTGASDHLGFYLPHAIAALASVLGPGIDRVQAVSLRPAQDNPQHAEAPVVVYAEYGDRGPAARARGVVEMIGPGAKWYGFVLKLFGAEAEGAEIHFEVSYDRLLAEMARFFRTGQEPVPHDVLLEKTALYYGALRSAAAGGKPISVRDMLRGEGGQGHG